MIYIAIAKQINPDLLNEQLDGAYHGRPNAFWLVVGNGDLSIQVPESLDPEIARTVLRDHDASATSTKQALRSQVVTIAQTAVGVALQDLTQAQIKALFAIVLYKLGALDPSTLKVLPLSRWV